MASVKQEKIVKFRPQRRNLNRHKQRGMGTLETSMRKLGYVAPMTAAADGEIIDGSARLETSAIVFDDDVLVVHHDGTKPIIMVRDDIASADSPEAREISIAANRIAELNLDWDVEQLLADAQAGLDLQGLFEQSELDAMLAELTPPMAGSDTEPQIDKAEELRQKWGVESGQLWQLGQHRLICGDCTDKATVERLMGGDRADMMFTDPPYGVSFKGQLLSNTTVDGVQVNHHKGANARHDDIENDTLTGEELTFFCVDFLGAAKSTGVKAWYICFAQLYLDSLLIAMRKEGLEWRSIIAWVKNQATLSNRDYKMRYEPIVYGQSGGVFYGERYHEEDVWEITRTLKNDLHPTMKPVELVERSVKNSSQDNSIVYDPFLGSGTTLIAAHNLNRRCFGAEISPAYCGVILQRFFDHTGIQPQLIA